MKLGQKERIVEATIRSLARDGYGGLTMRRIAREANVTQGSLHYYFKDREAILESAVTAIGEKLRSAIGRVSGTRMNANDRIAALITGCLMLTDEERAFWSATIHVNKLRRTHSDFYQRLRLTLAEAIKRGSNDHQFRSMKSEDQLREASSIVVALIEGMVLQRTVDPEVFDVAQTKRFCLQAGAQYLKPQQQALGRVNARRSIRRQGHAGAVAVTGKKQRFASSRGSKKSPRNPEEALPGISDQEFLSYLERQDDDA